MAAIRPTNFFELIVDEFIQNATNQLNTVSGVIGTLSLYPPVPTPSLGIVYWTGYTIPPTTYTKEDVNNRLILNDILNNPLPNNVELETDPVVNLEANLNKAENSGYRVNDSAGGFDAGTSDLVVAKITSTPVISASTIYSEFSNLGTLTDQGDYEGREDIGGENGPTYSDENSGGGGGGSGYSGTSTVQIGRLTVKTGGRTTPAGLTREQYLKQRVLNADGGIDIRNVDLSKDWVEITAQYNITRESFRAGPARIDVDKLRLGYGSAKIWDIGASEPRDVIEGDITTEPQARKTLYWQIRGTFKQAVVGTSAGKITEDDWNALKETQKAALVIHCYNCGSFDNTPGVVAAIKAKDYIAAGSAIINGPIRGGEVVYPGLIKRRAEEAALFVYGL